MAVPKKRTTSATRGQRRSHDALVPTKLVVVKNSKHPIPRRIKRAVELGLVTLEQG